MLERGCVKHRGQIHGTRIQGLKPRNQQGVGKNQPQQNQG